MSKSHRPKTIVDVARDTLAVDHLAGCDMPKLTRSPVAMRRLAEGVRDWEATAKVPPLATGEVRPLVMPLPNASPLASARSGFGPLAWAWREARSSETGGHRLAASLTRHLLYAHSVALGNPLDVPRLDTSLARMRHDLQPHSIKTDSYTTDRWYQGEVAGALNALAAVEELVDAGALVIIPARLIPEQPGSLIYRAVWSRGDPAWNEATDPLGPLTVEDYIQIQEEASDRVSWSPSSAEPLYRQRRVLDLGDLVGAALVTGSTVDVDVYLPSALSERMLKVAVEKAGVELRRDAGLIDLQFLPTLLELELPQLDALALQDIIAIRRDGLFSLWHESMSRGLQQAAGLPPDVLLHDERAAALIRAEVADAARGVAEQVRASALLTRVRAGSLDLTVSSAIATAALFEVTHGDPKSLVVAPAQVLAKVVLEWLRGRPRPGQAALVRHAQLFETAK